MSANYIPILKAKPGEFQAISHATKSHSRKMLPLFEISRIGESVRKRVRFKNASALTCAYLDEIAEQIADVWEGRAALVDAFQWRADSITESGEHVLPYIYSKLQSYGVDVIPVIGYDRWDSQAYRLAMQGLEVSANHYCCLRLDSHAIEDSREPDLFKETVLGILDDMELEPARCSVLIDFGDITSLSVEDLVNQATRVVTILEGLDFRFFATAGCSLPTSIDGAVKKPDSTGKVVRKEMLLWQALMAEYPSKKWLFGDYGVRGPNSVEDIIAPHTNGKIRHTIGQSYYIVRGHSNQIGDKGAQMYKLAKKVVESQHYMSDNFSWGDERILACSRGEFKGNSTTWISIDTSHHIAWVVAEVEEYEIKVAASTKMKV